MTSNSEISQFVHHENVLRYRKLLASYLTAHERRFVERRLAEEQAALKQFGRIIASKEVYAA